jgi:hypothetical protein
MRRLPDTTARARPPRQEGLDPRRQAEGAFGERDGLLVEQGREGGVVGEVPPPLAQPHPLGSAVEGEPIERAPAVERATALRPASENGRPSSAARALRAAAGHGVNSRIVTK